MLRDDRKRAQLERVQKRGKRFLQLEDNLIGRRRRNAVNIGRGNQTPAGMSLAEEFVCGENDVVRGERLSVMPLYIVLQREGIGQAVGRDGPGFGKRGERF
jgi:hypothetical protein